MSVMFLNIRKVGVSSGSYASVIEYYGREEAVNPDEALKVTFDHELEQADDIIEYYGRFHEVGQKEPGFDFKGPKSNLQALTEMETFQPEEIYQSIISFTADDAKRLGLGNESDFKRIAETYVIACSRQLKIDHKNVVWGGYIHSNTQNPHMHIYLYDKTRKELPLLKKRELYAVRSSLGNAIMSQVDSYKEKDLAYKMALEEVKMMFKDKNLDALIASRTIRGHHRLVALSDQDKKIVLELKELALTVPLTGKKSAAIIEKYHPEANGHLKEVTKLLLENSKGSSEYHTLLRGVRDNFEVLYGDMDKADVYVDNQIERLERRVGNEIIRFVVKERDVLLHPEFKINDAPLSFGSSLNLFQSALKSQFNQGLHQFMYSKQAFVKKERDQEEEAEYEDEINT